MAGFRSAAERMKALAPNALLPGHGPACRGDEVGKVLDDLIGYVDWIAELAAGVVRRRADAAGGRAEGRRRARTPTGPRASGSSATCTAPTSEQNPDYEPPVPLNIPQPVARDGRAQRRPPDRQPRVSAWSPARSRVATASERRRAAASSRQPARRAGSGRATANRCRPSPTSRAVPSGSTTSATQPLAAPTTSRVKTPSSSFQATAIGPCGETCSVWARVTPPPGRGATRNRRQVGSRRWRPAT